jgi:hypothetical protein
VLTFAQAKVLGPLQPVGSARPEIANPEIASPSLEVNVTATVWVAPMTTDTVPAMEGVATTESSLPFSPPPPPVGMVPPVPPVPPPPVLPSDPTLLLVELNPQQPDSSRRQKTPRRSERWPGCIAFDFGSLEDFRFNE